MATAAILGGGLLLGGITSGIGASKQAAAQEASAKKALAASQASQATQEGRAETLFDQQQLTSNAQLGLLGQGGDPNAAQNLLNSPLVQAINQQNQQSTNAQAAASGVSGGNLLSALQQQNTGTILQAGFGGLGQIGNQALGGSQGFAGLGINALGQANQAQTQVGNAQGAGAAAPFLAAANTINQGTQLAGFGLSGGFSGAPVPAAAPPNPFGSPFANGVVL